MNDVYRYLNGNALCITKSCRKSNSEMFSVSLGSFFKIFCSVYLYICERDGNISPCTLVIFGFCCQGYIGFIVLGNKSLHLFSLFFLPPLGKYMIEMICFLKVS